MSFFEETNPSDISFSQVFQSIKLYLPKIEKKNIKFLYHGTYNVFSVMDKFIFRFPDVHLRNSKGVQLIKREVEILRILCSHLDLPIPNPIFISTNENNPFMAYEKLKGVSLNTIFNQIPINEKIKVAKEIGTFLSQLHYPKFSKMLTRTDYKSYNFSYQKYREEWTDRFEDN